MTRKMSNVEHWILDFVVEAKDTLHMLVPENLGYVFYRPPGFSIEQLTDALEQMFDQEEILAQTADRELAAVPHPPFVPTRTEIESGLLGRERIYFGLTAKGGALWEAYSSPEWDRFVRAHYGGIECRGTITSADHSVVLQFLEWQHYREQITVIPSSEKWETLRPWPATYWKVLPAASSVSFQFTRNRPRESQCPVPDAVQQWFHHVRHWYTPYLA